MKKRINMKGHPKFNYNDEVKFNLDGEIKKGIV